MELCRDLFGNPRKVTRSKMFGHYLHALTAHSPTQYELTSLRSLNTENQERLFGQGRVIAEACTNHHLENVIPQVMLRLQAKQERHMAMTSVKKGDTQVTHVAKDLPKLPGTTVKNSFIKHRKDSWQNHLQRISPFLVAGEDAWWTSVDGGFHFRDGDGDSNTQSEDGFTLLHFRQHLVVDVEERRKRCWNRIIEDRIVIPASEVKVYDEDGTVTGRLRYCDGTATFVPFSVDTLTSAPEIPDPDSSVFEPVDALLDTPHPDEDENTILKDASVGARPPLGESTSTQLPPLEVGDICDLPQSHEGMTTGEYSASETGHPLRSHIHLPMNAYSQGLTTSLTPSDPN